MNKNKLFFIMLLMLTASMMTDSANAQNKRRLKKSNSNKVKSQPTKKSVEAVELMADPDRRTRNIPGGNNQGKAGKDDIVSTHKAIEGETAETVNSHPKSSKLIKAGSFDGDVRNLKYSKPKIIDRPEHDPPGEENVFIGDPVVNNSDLISGATATAPAPIANFAGLDLTNWGGGYPPDTNGDVGPNHFIQSINSSVGIYRKSDGNRLAAFRLNTFMSQGSFGNLCDTNNFGDPVVLYDSFEDRWIVTDFAFTTDASGNLTSNAYECFAVSKTGDPVTGGWNYYSTVDTDALNDYPKLGVWSDGIYMSSNMFARTGGAFTTVRLKALNKAQMYAGSPTVQVVTFDAPAGEFTVLPGNARLQTGTPPAGTPNLMSVVWQYTNAVSVYKFKVDWNKISTSTLTGPALAIAPASWGSAPATVPTLSGNAIQTLQPRLMVQNQYTNIGGVESLWNSHTVLGAAGQSAVRYYQVNVTGGAISASTTQAFTHNPDTTVNRFMPSVAVDRAGDMALAYTASSATLFPAIRYAGKLAGDAANTALSQTENSLIEGTGTQTNTCGGTCTRWGDYSAMTLDPDGCTFWMTSEYYAVSGGNYQTRIGSFAFPSCVPLLNNGALQGTVTSSVTNLPISGATVNFGSRTAITNASGVYTFANLPAGTYPGETAAATGYNSASAVNLTVADGTATTQNFTLGVPASSACLTDTTQSDFLSGVPNKVDLTTSPDNAVLTVNNSIDQQNNAGTTTGTGFNATSWGGQTFIPAVTGLLTKIDTVLFCSGCTGTTPNITVSLRNTTGGLPTGADLATGTITGFSSSSSGNYSVIFSSPVNVTAGTQYAVLLRPTANPSVGSGYFWIRASPSSYANGQRVVTADSGATWTADATRDFNFKTYVQTGYSLSGDLVSSLKDSNPAAAGNSVWSTISWNATVPANTTLQFQVAGSNSVNGPFNFVGPNGTAATFFAASGSSLSQFNGLRYIKYKALMTTTVSTVTPTLNDVTICFTNPPLFVWTGANSSNWNDPLNWMGGTVPGTADKAVIPASGVINSPVNTTNNTVALLELDSSIIDTGGNSLTVTTCAPNAVTGGSAASFIKGTLVRCVDGTGSYNFPVGSINGFAPVSLSGIVGSGTFSVAAKSGNLAGSDPANSITRNWGLTPSGINQANVTFNYLDSDVPAGASESAFKFLRLSGGMTTAFAPSSSDTTANSFTLNNVASFSDWSLGALAPTAAGSTVSGKVLDLKGKGIPNAVLELRSARTNSAVSVRTNNFGNFSFSEVVVGQDYVISVKAKNYTFTPRLISVRDNLSGISFSPVAANSGGK